MHALTGQRIRPRSETMSTISDSSAFSWLLAHVRRFLLNTVCSPILACRKGADCITSVATEQQGEKHAVPSAMRSLLVWRSTATAKSIWVNRHCKLVGPFSMTHMFIRNGTAWGHLVPAISSSRSFSESLHHERGSPKDSGIAITLELKGAREFFETLLATSTSAPPSPGFDVSADAKLPTQGALTPHLATGPKTLMDVEVFKAAMAECTQQAQNLLAFAKKAGLAAEDLTSAPVEFKEKPGANARGASSLSHKGFPMTALQVQATQPWADTKVKDAQAQVSMAEHMRLTSSHASLRLEHSRTVDRLHNLESRIELAERQRTAPLAELDTLRSRCSDLELLDNKHQEPDNDHTELIHKYEQVTDHEQHLERMCQTLIAQQDQHQLELSEIDELHQELNNEHAELSHKYEQVTDHEQHLEQQCQTLIAHWEQTNLQLSEAEELHRQALAELEHTKQTYVTDVHRLQDEVLSLEDQLHAKKLDLEHSMDAHEKQLQQQSREALEHHNKAVKQLSEYNSKYDAGLQQQLKRQEAKRAALVTEMTELRQLLGRSEDNKSHLRQRLMDCTSNLTCYQDKLEASELQCSELEQELAQSRASQCDSQSQLATLQADLKKLHDLTAGGSLTADDLFLMFAKPVSLEGSGSSHSLEESSAPSATASTPAATAASDSSETERALYEAGDPFSDPSQGTSHSGTALASGTTPSSKGTPEASAAAPNSAADTAANSSGKHMECGRGSNTAVDEPSGSWPAGTVQADKELHDDEGVDISIEDMSRDERASILQEQLAIHYRCRYLSHTSALYLGAKAYASSAPEHDFSTEEVILSMLQHDSTFLQLLAKKSHEAGIDQFTLELAVADTYHNLVEQEEGMFQRGRRPTFTCSSRVVASRSEGAIQTESLPEITMVIPSNYQKVYQIALQSLYQYWGIPCVPDMYRK